MGKKEEDQKKKDAKTIHQSRQQMRLNAAVNEARKAGVKLDGKNHQHQIKNPPKDGVVINSDGKQQPTIPLKDRSK